MAYGTATAQKQPLPQKAGVKLDLSKTKVGNLADMWRRRLGELLELSPDQEKRLKKFLKKNITAWQEDTSELHERLKANNDLVEGVVEETGWPFEDAPNYHIPITGIYMKLYHSVERRSILGADLVWYGEADEDDLLADITADIDDMMNSKARKEWNVTQALSDVFWTTDRDGLGILKCPYEEEYETATDILLITNPDEFMDEFPDPEAAGLSPDEYEALVVQIATEAKEDAPLEIPITFEKQVYAGPRAHLVELVDFVTFPATVEDIRSKACRGYGNRFSLRRGAVKEKKRSGAWYAKAVTELLKNKKSREVSDYQRSKDEVEGLNRTDTSDEMEFYELTVKFELDKGQGERKILLTYNVDCDILMAAMDYPYRVDFFALFRIAKRPGRQIGVSVPDETRDLNEEIDQQHNQRLLSRMIATVPSFKGKASAQGEDGFDPDASENRWRPGVIFWLKDPEAFEQFKVQPTDQGESLQEEKNDMSLLDLLLGSAASLLSGQASPTDPSAPGNKTGMLIGQSNMRMDDPLAELRQGVEQMGDICLSHVYQFGPAVIEYMVDDESGNRELRTLHKKYLRTGIKMRMAGVTVVNNPDTEMQKWFQLLAQVMQMAPEIAQDAGIRFEWLRTALRAGRVQNRKNLLPSPEQIHEHQVQIAMEAQKRLMLEQAQLEMEAAQTAADQRLKQGRQQVAVKKTAEQMASAGLGYKPSANGSARGV